MDAACDIGPYRFGQGVSLDCSWVGHLTWAIVRACECANQNAIYDLAQLAVMGQTWAMICLFFLLDSGVIKAWVVPCL